MCKISPNERVIVRQPLLQTYLEDGNDILAVSLLGDVTQPSCDVNASADIHVYLHSLFLNLALQIRKVLKITGLKNNVSTNF